MVGKFIHFNWLYLDEIPTSCRTWGNTTIRVELSAFFYIFLCTKMGAFLFYTCEIKGEKKSTTKLCFPPSLPPSFSISVSGYITTSLLPVPFFLLLYSQDKNKLTVSQGRETEWERSCSRLCFSLQFSLSWCALFFKCLHWKAQGLKQACMHWANDTVTIPPYFHISFFGTVEPSQGSPNHPKLCMNQWTRSVPRKQAGLTAQRWLSIRPSPCEDTPNNLTVVLFLIFHFTAYNSPTHSF